MKRILTVSLTVVLAMTLLVLAGCGKSEFGVSENTEKKMTITAENAARNALFVAGSLAVEEGEEIAISASLKKGEVRVEILAAPEMEKEEYPEIDETPIMTADLGDGDSESGTLPAGYYLVKAACLEKATGTVQIEVTTVE